MKIESSLTAIDADDIFDVLLASSQPPLARTLDVVTAEFEKVDAAPAESAQGSLPLDSLGATAQEVSSYSSLSSGATEADSAVPQQNTVDQPPATPVVERSSTKDLRVLFGHTPAPPPRSPTVPYQARRLSMPPMDHTKGISLDDDDDVADRGADTQPTDLLHAGKDAGEEQSGRPQLASNLTGGFENKENSRTAAHSFFSRFAFNGVKPSSGSPPRGSPAAAASRKRKSPASSASSNHGSSLGSLNDSFSSASVGQKRLKTAESSVAVLSTQSAVVIPDSDDEFL